MCYDVPKAIFNYILNILSCDFATLIRLPSCQNSKFIAFDNFKFGYKICQLPYFITICLRVFFFRLQSAS